MQIGSEYADVREQRGAAAEDRWRAQVECGGTTLWALGATAEEAATRLREVIRGGALRRARAHA